MDMLRHHHVILDSTDSEKNNIDTGNKISYVPGLTSLNLML